MQTNIQDFSKTPGNSTESANSNRTEWPPFDDYGPTRDYPIPDADGIEPLIGPERIDVRQLSRTPATPEDFELGGGGWWGRAENYDFRPNDGERSRDEPEHLIAEDLAQLYGDGDTDEDTSMTTENDETAEDGAETDENEPIAVDPDGFDVADHAGESVLLISGITSLVSSPETLEGEISSSGKTIAAEKHGNTIRLDAETILSGDSEYRDSCFYELYTPGRYRSNQRSNLAPGPQAGSNSVSEAEDLPTPTHWPAIEQSDDVPDECPGCGAVAAPFAVENLVSPRCEACGETLENIEADQENDEDDGDEWPDATNMQTWERAGVIETGCYSLLITRLHRAAGFDTVLRADAVDENGTEYRLRAPSGDDRLMINTDDPAAVVIMDETPTYDAEDVNYAGRDEERLRSWLQSKYDRGGDNGDGGISRDTDDGDDGGSGGSSDAGDTPTLMTDGGVWQEQSGTQWCWECQRYRIDCAHMDP